MCVIIYIPQGKSISEKEINAAWKTNEDGAGFSYRKDGEIHYSRGFMTLGEYKEAIEDIMSQYDLMLHFRITTSREVNKIQTHPYAIEDIESLEGKTNMAISMNGVVSKQKTYKGYNDTMSFIKDNKILFNRVLKNDDYKYWGDKISSVTHAKWCMMKKDKTYTSKNFIEIDGIKYSNLNHKIYTKGGKKMKAKVKKTEALERAKRDVKLINKVNNFIYEKCHKNYCDSCTKCLNSALTIRDIKTTLKENI